MLVELRIASVQQR